MHLNPKAYHLVQLIAHGNYKETLAKLDQLLEIKKGEIIVELACGDEGFSEYYINKGCEYYGIDVNKERIKIAQEKNSKGHFFTSDILEFDFKKIPPTNKYFCHGFLHHLNDRQCIQLVNKITHLRNDVIFVAIEPIRVKHWYHNPLAWIIVNMDDGKYIRTLDKWYSLLNPWKGKVEILSRLLRHNDQVLFFK